jgi:hypothetical protein
LAKDFAFINRGYAEEERIVARGIISRAAAATSTVRATESSDKA